MTLRLSTVFMDFKNPQKESYSFVILRNSLALWIMASTFFLFLITSLFINTLGSVLDNLSISKL